MTYLELCEAEKLVHWINDQSNPQAADNALELRDKWLLENEIGLLQMTDEVLSLLKNVSKKDKSS